MHRRPLPPDLPSIFGVSHARALGVPRSRLGAHDLAAPFHGVRASAVEKSPDTDPAALLEERARAYSVRMLEEEFFSHATAAVLWGLPTGRPVDADVLHVTVPAPLRAPRSRGIRGHQVREHLATVVEVRGLRVSDPASTWVMLAARYDETHLVCIGDAIIRDLPDPGLPDRAPRLRPLADMRSSRHSTPGFVPAGRPRDGPPSD